MIDDKLEVTIELLDAKGDIERLIARAATVPIARGAFNAAVLAYGAYNAVRMRHGSRIVEMHDMRP